MCESIPSVTLWGTTQLTSTITTSTVLTTQIAQSTRLITSQIVTKEVVTSLIPQQTLYYPCSDSTTPPPARPTSAVNKPAQPRPDDHEEEGEGARDPKATGQFTGSLPPTRSKPSLSFTSPPVRSSSVLSFSSVDMSKSISSTSIPSSTIGDNDTITGESQEGSSSTPKSNGGIIAGAIVGGLFGLLLLIALIMCCQKRRARRRRRGDSWTDNEIQPNNNYTGGSTGGEVGKDYWERRFREIESANSSKAGQNGLGLNGMQTGLGNGMTNLSEKGNEKMDWDSQTSRKLRLTLNLGSNDLESRPPSRLSMISSFFGGRMTPTPNVMSTSSPYHHTRNGSTPTLRSMGNYHGNGKNHTKGSGSRFSFNPFKRHNQKPSYTNNHSRSQSQNQLSNSYNQHKHNRSISSPWNNQEDSKSFKSTTTHTRSGSGNRSAGYSNSNKSPGPRPSLEDGFNNYNNNGNGNNGNGNNVNRSASKSTTATTTNEKKRRSQNTFGNKMSSFDLPITTEDDNLNQDNNVNINNENIDNNDNINKWNYQTTNTIQPPPQAMTVNTNNLNSNGSISGPSTGNTLGAIREGRVIESPTEEEIEERRNMEWIRHSNILSDHGEGTETLDSTDEEKLRDLKAQLGIEDLPDTSGIGTGINFNVKPFLGFAQFNSTIGNTPPQLGAIGTHTSISNSNSHLSGISSIPSLPPARGGYSSGISTITGNSSSFGNLPFVPPPRQRFNSQFSGISTITSGTITGTGTGTGTGSGSGSGSGTGTGTYNSSTNLPFIPPIRGGHGSLTGLSITPSTVLPRGYLSGLSSAHSFTNKGGNSLRPKSPDSISIPSDIIIGGSGGIGLQRNNSQSTISSLYSNRPISPYSNSTQPSFGFSRPNSQISDLATMGNSTYQNRNTRTLTFYKSEKDKDRASRPQQYSRKSTSSINKQLKRSESGRVLSYRESLQNFSSQPIQPIQQNRKSAFADADEDFSLQLDQIPELPITIPSPLPPSIPSTLPLPLCLPVQSQGQNRKSAFTDADENCVEIPAEPPLTSQAQIQSKPHITDNYSPPPTSSYITTENITRRSLKNQRESKGKHVPKIRLSQRALTPSLWIDEELLARFAEVENSKTDRDSYFSDDYSSTVKPTPIKEKNNHLRNDQTIKEIKSQENEVENKINNNLLSTTNTSKSDQNTLISRFSNSTQGSVSRKSSLASNATIKSGISDGSRTVNDHISSKSQAGSSSRLNTNLTVNPNNNSRSGSTISSKENTVDRSRSPAHSYRNNVQNPREEPAPSSLTPKPSPRQLTRKEKGKGKEKEIPNFEISQSSEIPIKLSITSSSSSSTPNPNTNSSSNSSSYILSPNTPPNKLPLFSPSFPKPPTPPLPSLPSLTSIDSISTWTQENSINSGLNFRFSIKQRRKNQQNNITKPNGSQSEFDTESESGFSLTNGNLGKSVVTPQLPFLTLGSVSANTSASNSNGWKSGLQKNDVIQNKKKSAYEDADEGENEFFLDRI